MTSPAALSPTPFGRVVTAMVTPFDASGAVDLPLAGRLARHLVGQGSDGLVVSGTTGESPTLSWQEQLQLLQAVREAVGSDAQVLAGTGSNSTAEAVEATSKLLPPVPMALLWWCPTTTSLLRTVWPRTSVPSLRLRLSCL